MLTSLYVAIPLLTLVALSEATVLPYLQVNNAQPDLTLLLVSVWSLRRGVEEGAAWAFIGGFVLDLLSAGPFTVAMFGLLAASLVLGIDPTTGLGRRQTQAAGANPLALIASVIVATLVFHLVGLVVLQFTPGGTGAVDGRDALTRVIAPRSVFNLVLMPFVYGALGWLDRRTRREEYVL